MHPNEDLLPLGAPSAPSLVPVAFGLRICGWRGDPMSAERKAAEVCIGNPEVSYPGPFTVGASIMARNRLHPFG